ncbi:hypothetical protein D1007_06039 [Hordeum vulgare]|nr:hypothetical protein D1007_06039 [Hordeum vulgare]
MAHICYVGRIVRKTSGAVIHASKWSSAVGSKGVMEVAWVKISNIPLDKRSERNLAYVASLVGVPVEIDAATLHRSACAWVKLGCSNIDVIAEVAESMLGGYFYDFYYEVDQVLWPWRGIPSSTRMGDKQDLVQESQESTESDVSLHTSLLIGSMAMDYMEHEKQVVGPDATHEGAENGAAEYIVESPDSSFGH